MIVYLENGKAVNIDEKKEITRGGEGMIIKIGSDQVAKIYLPGIPTLSESKYQSLFALKSNEFIKPEILLYDKKKKVVGFTMKMVDPETFPLLSVFNSTFCQRIGLDWDFKFKMAEKLIQAVKYIHSQNILIGDLNPLNILAHENGSVYFIDIDSYQTPGHPHSGRLLDDIRDYLYHGKITTESDYFALSVMVFNLLTNIHPYKGVHDVYKGLAERMIHQLSVLNPDSHLKIPKCYQPLSDPHLIQQFSRIFNQGERFMLELKPSTKVQVKKSIKQKIGNLVITEIFLHPKIKYIQTNDKFLVIHTTDQVLVYDVSYKGIFKKITEFPETETYLSSHGLFIRQGNILDYIDLNTQVKSTIKNFQFKKPLCIHPYENVLVSVEEDMMYYLYLDQILNDQIRMEVKNIYGPSFRKNIGLFQKIVGNSYGLYNNHGILNQIKFTEKLHDLYQNGNVGCIQYIENEKIKYKIFRVNGLRVETSLEMEHFKFIAPKDQMILIAEDDGLTILRAEDFSEIAKFNCSLVDEDTQVFNTLSGIIIQNDGGVYLLNSK